MSDYSVALLMCVYIGDKLEPVKNAVESIFEQSHQPDQIIIILDGPVFVEVEKYLDQLDSFHDNIVLKKLLKNIGLPMALNFGLDFVMCNWVARFDADDIMQKNRIMDQVSYLKNNSIDVLGAQIEEFDELKNNFNRNVPLNIEDIKKRLPWRNPFNHVTIIYKTSVIKSYLYRDIPGYEDYDLWYRILKNADLKVANLDVVLVRVRVGLEMYGRRSGFSYAVRELKFRKSTAKYSSNLFIHWIAGICRMFISIVPKEFKASIYKKLLRSRSS
jgi:hypothetical protein